MMLTHVYKTLKLLVEWLELGIYDFSSFPFAMNAHLSEESKKKLQDAVDNAVNGELQYIVKH